MRASWESWTTDFTAGVHVEGSVGEIEGSRTMHFPDGEVEESQIGFMRAKFRMSRLEMSFRETEEISFAVMGAADAKWTILLKNDRSSSRMDRFIGG